MDYALILEMPDSGDPVSVYGPDPSYKKLDDAGHLLTDGSSGWRYVVVAWPLPDIQPPVFDSV